MASSGSGGDEGELSRARLLATQVPTAEDEAQTGGQSSSRSDAVAKRFAVPFFVCLAMLGVSSFVASRVHNAMTRYSHLGLQLNSENPQWNFSLVGEADHACQDIGASVRFEEGTNFARAMLHALWSEPNKEIHAGVASLPACRDMCLKDLSCRAIEYSSGDLASCAIWHSEVSAGLQANNTACYRFSVSSDGDRQLIAGIANGDVTITQTTVTSVTATETSTFATTTATSTTTATQTSTSATFTTVTVDEYSWFTTVDGGEGRACRGLQAESSITADVRSLSDEEEGSPGSGKPIIVLPWNVTSIDDCKTVCVRARRCHGIEYSRDLQLCKVWVNKTVADSVEASNSTCLRFTLSGKTGEGDTSCPEAWPKPKHPFCSELGENCLVSGCCSDPQLTCYTKDAFWAECRATCIPGMKDVVYDKTQSTWSCEQIGCGSFPGRFVPPGGWWTPPPNATAHNGAQLADVFLNKAGGHVFLIGDWGGVMHEQETADETHKRCNDEGNSCDWSFVHGIDDKAQYRVRDAMVHKAPKLRPDYVLNVGDNFYWGGVEQTCMRGNLTDIWTTQFEKLYEQVYRGDGLDSKQWLGVLGNHDWGGWRFDRGWDKAIGYTWHKPTSRWMTPALYYRAKVWYSNFAIDYFFMDTNVLNAMEATIKSSHNLCSLEHNDASSSCAPAGPKNAWDCHYWFKSLWSEQKRWFYEVAPQSTGDWRIVITHFPPYWMTYEWVEMAKTHEIDMIITGHRHHQRMHMMGDNVVDIWVDDPAHLKTNFIDPTSYITTGGGGGITSENMPVYSGEDDQYGFMDLFATKDTLRVEAFSHTGKSRRVMWVPHTYRHNNSRAVWKERSA